MFTRLSIPLALCLAAFATTTYAGCLPVPTVEYSADRIMESSAGTFEGKVYAAMDKERSETNMKGMQSVMILRRDKELGWMLMPDRKMYQQLDFKRAQEQSGSQPAEQIDISEVGAETVEGHATIKYKMMMKDGSAGGFIWVTQDGIAVKMDMLSKHGRDKTRMTMTLKNLTIGAQDPELFELPSDYTAMPSFGGLGKPGGLRDAAKSIFKR